MELLDVDDFFGFVYGLFALFRSLVIYLSLLSFAFYCLRLWILLDNLVDVEGVSGKGRRESVSFYSSLIFSVSCSTHLRTDLALGRTNQRGEESEKLISLEMQLCSWTLLIESNAWYTIWRCLPSFLCLSFSINAHSMKWNEALLQSFADSKPTY